MVDPGADDITFEPRMSASDALMWAIEKDPLLRSTITTVMRLDRPVDLDRFRLRVDRATRVVPRLRQRVRGRPWSIAPPRWEVDPNFDLDYHLRVVRAPGDGSDRALLDLAEPIAMQGFDRARPLWEFTLVDGLADGGAAVIAKVHHAITDGVGGMKLQMELLDLERDPGDEPPLPEAPAPHVLGELARMADAVGFEANRAARTSQEVAGALVRNAGRAVSDPVGVGVEALDAARSAARLLGPAVTPMSPLWTHRSLSVRFDTLALDLAALKDAGRLVGGRLNDAFLAGVTGGLARYHRRHAPDGAVPHQLRMSMPVSVRGERTAALAGNQFAPARFAVTIDLDDPLERMARVREEAAEARAEPALGLTGPLASFLNRLPVTATTGLFGAMLRGVDVVCSNVPGAPVPVYVAGARVLAQIPFGPMAGAAANITLLSWQDRVNLGINTDPAAVTDPQGLVADLAASFAEVEALVRR